MIVVKLMAGVGNQMFQYALGRHLSLINNDVLKLDITTFFSREVKYSQLRRYTINQFNIVENVADQGEIDQFYNIIFRISKINNILFRARRKLNLFSSGHIEERQFNFNPSILRLSGNVYLNGFWQTEKYFKNIENTIRKDFTLKNPMSKRAQIITEKIKDTHAISMHIRRNDYVTNKNINNAFGLCSPAYYSEAVSILKKHVERPYFFVFSDDTQWVKNNIHFSDPVFFVSDEGVPDYEEIILMSMCKHNIIANSSFSWWGAWLNANPDKIIIAPDKWFNTFRGNTSDVVPQSWLRISK